MKTIQVLLIAVVVALSLLVPSQAQTPAQGPDAPGANAFSLPATVITAMVKQKVEEVLANTNADLAARNDFRAHLSYSFTEYAPRISTTQYTDRPNQRFVQIPYIFTYHVTNMRKHTALGWISYPWSRKISHSIDLNVFCQRWFATTGELTAAADADPPYLDSDQSIPEQALNIFVNGWLADTIDSRIRAQLRNINASTGTIGLGAACNQLGVATVAQGFPYNSIEYKTFPRPKFDLPTFDNVSVKVLKIKRLTARANGAPLYNLIENIGLDFYVNQQPGKGGEFTMAEGNEEAITHPLIQFRRPGNNQNVVLIFNVRQLNSPFTVDSNFAVHTAGQNFGHGTHTIQVYKSYWMPPRPPINKPFKVSVPAYEITYQINAPQIVIQK
ncbi:MAG TPA: hypothetical protein VFZ34_32825 [Blastocatellia bacterium]|nr:hypothetical protein [Blastocatellia bacterium]